MPWSEKHHEFFQTQNMWAATTNMACYLYRRCKANEPVEMEFDTNKFQQYMKRTKGKEYHRTYIPKIVRQLEEKSEGLVVILKDYGRGIYRIIVHPLSFLTENKKLKQESSHNQNLGNPMFSNEHKERKAKQQQQFISKTSELFKEIGLNFDLDALNRIWRLSGKSIGLVVKTIKHLLYRHEENPGSIKNPHGFVMDSLRYRWAEKFDPYYQPELPRFESRMDIEKFVTGLTQEILSPQASERWQT